MKTRFGENPPHPKELITAPIRFKIVASDVEFIKLTFLFGCSLIFADKKRSRTLQFGAIEP